MGERKRPPRIKKIKDLELPEPHIYQLGNGIPVYVTSMGTQEVVKLEVVFKAGRPFEHKNLIARTTTALHKEGTKAHDSATIAEHFDFYGSNLSVPFHLDTSNFILYSLNRHFDKVLPLFAEIIGAPAFPATELEAYIRRNQQRLQVDLSKNDVLAYRKITEYVFGENHPYGYNSFPETYAAIRRADLLQHRQEFYNSGNCSIFISGKVTEKELALLDQHFSEVIPTGASAQASPIVTNQPAGKRKISHPDNVQTAIRIGRRLFNRRHPDFNGMYVLNTILGGYFGSRLMENIREEKGYTYNIYATVDTMLYDGYLLVGTEVGNEFVKDTLHQIYLEMDQLQQKRVGREELEMVRSYLLGNFLTMLDGPFNVSEIIRTLVVEDLPLYYFADLVRTVQEITPDQLQALAQKYLQKEDMWEVVVG